VKLWREGEHEYHWVLFEENAKALQSVMSLYEDGALSRLLGQPPPRATVAEVAGGAERQVRIGGEMMGAPKCRNVGKSQSVLIMIDPIISTRTRTNWW
jgi:hypothetical protein